MDPIEKNDLPEVIPTHIAIIMDGNGRWAKKKNLSRISGHIKGVDSVREVVTACRELGIKVLTLYAFSVENWQRPKAEVTALMELLKEYLLKECEEMMTNQIRLCAIGKLKDLPMEVQTTLDEVMKKTEKGTGMTVNLALSYGGRSEILHAVRNMIYDLNKGRIKEEEIDEQVFSKYLWTGKLPDPDLLIRTSGEFRISNFLLWQILWPL